MANSPGLWPIVADAGPSFAAPSSAPQLPFFGQSSLDLQQLLIVPALVVFRHPDDATALAAWTPLAGQLFFDQFQLSGPAFVVLLSHPVTISAQLP